MSRALATTNGIVKKNMKEQSSIENGDKQITSNMDQLKTPINNKRYKNERTCDELKDIHTNIMNEHQRT